MISTTPPSRRAPVALAATVAALLALVLTGCSPASSDRASGSANAAAADGWPRTVQTADGDLTLDAAPERIVSTSTTLTGSLLAIGAPVVASAATVPDVPGLSDERGFFSQWSDEAEKAGVEKLYENAEPNLEKIIQYDPDLIVVSETGGDSAMDSVAQLRKIAPVLVLNYSGSSWQDITRALGDATGREDAANEVVTAFEKQVTDAKKSIVLPKGDSSAFIVFGDSSGAAALTESAPQVQVMKELGFTMAEIPASVKGGDTSMGGEERKDIVNLSLENIQKGLPGRNWIVVSADDVARREVTENKAFSTSPAVTEGNVVYTPGETFRLDYYSATMLVDSLVESYAK